MSEGDAFFFAFTPSLMAPEVLEAIFVQKRRQELACRLLRDIRDSIFTQAGRECRSR